VISSGLQLGLVLGSSGALEPGHHWDRNPEWLLSWRAKSWPPSSSRRRAEQRPPPPEFLDQLKPDPRDMRRRWARGYIPLELCSHHRHCRYHRLELLMEKVQRSYRSSSQEWHPSRAEGYSALNLDPPGPTQSGRRYKRQGFRVLGVRSSEKEHLSWLENMSVNMYLKRYS
jgi:hypothetical protein